VSAKQHTPDLSRSEAVRGLSGTTALNGNVNSLEQLGSHQHLTAIVTASFWKADTEILSVFAPFVAQAIIDGEDSSLAASDDLNAIMGEVGMFNCPSGPAVCNGDIIAHWPPLKDFVEGLQELRL